MTQKRAQNKSKKIVDQERSRAMMAIRMAYGRKPESTFGAPLFYSPLYRAPF